MHTIAAISTAIGVGGIGVIRISGDEAIETADKVFKATDGKMLKDMKGYTAKYGKIWDEDQIIDQAVALVFRAPHSYTGEDVVEISCHGGIYIVKKILDLILQCGAQLAQPGEFTKRAFLNGKLDLTEAESVMNLISSQGEKSSKLAINGVEGNVNKKTKEIKDLLLEIMSNLSAWADYPEEDIPQIEENLLKIKLDEIICELKKIVETYPAVRAVTDGIKVAIVGCPNVGKSSLLNLLMGYQRAIVTDIAGTTRDVVEGKTFIGDIPVSIFDTAGIRETVDVVEKLGVERAKEFLQDADITFILFDGSKAIGLDDKNVIDMVEKDTAIAIVNKADLKMNIEIDEIKKHFKRVVFISAKQNQGINELQKEVYDFVGMDRLNSADVVVSGERQLDIIKRAEKSLQEAQAAISMGVTLDAVTVLVQNAFNILAELTGENATEEIIDRVFSKFCLGK